MRCGSCNEVFDGNAALLEPLAVPPPVFAPAKPEIPPSPQPFPLDDAAVAAPDARVDDPASDEPIYTLELDAAMDQADSAQFGEPAAAPVEEEAFAPEPESAPFESDPAPESAPEWQPGMEPVPETGIEPEPVSGPGPGMEPGPELEPEAAEDEQPAATEPAPADPLDIKPMTHEELEAALAAELALMEQSIAAEAVAETPAAPASATGDRLEPTLDPDSRYDLDEADEEALVQLAAARERDSAPQLHTLLRAASAPPQDRYEPPEEIHSVQQAETPEA